MKMLFTGFVLGVGTACGVFFLFNVWQERLPKSTVDISLLCTARGGEWVYGSVLPLCMTKDAGLLEFVNGTFLPYEEKKIATNNEEAVSVLAQNEDPWKEGFEAPLRERAVQYEVKEEELDEASLTMETEEREVEIAEEKENETCEEIKSEEMYKGRIASVDFSSWPEARKYKTAIEKDVARGVNFAGSYIVATWGCGTKRTPCVGHAVIDAQTGKILLYKEDAKRTGEFSRDTSSLVLNGEQGEETWNLQEGKLIRCND